VEDSGGKLHIARELEQERERERERERELDSGGRRCRVAREMELPFL
jgi:hypothetical protein